MILVYMNGGLGNQIFQYMFFRWLEITSGQTCAIDDGLFFGQHVPHNGYELEHVFGIHPQRLSKSMPSDVWQFMVDRRDQEGLGIAQQLLDSGMPLSVIRERGVTNIIFHGHTVEYSLGEQLPVGTGDLYFHGYWLGSVCFSAAEELLRQEWTFPIISEPQNCQYEEQIKNCHCPVAVHVRRGDMASLGWSCRPEFFAAAVRRAVQDFPVDGLFLFSDDLSWCHEKWDALGLRCRIPVTEISGNSGSQSFRDLQLMSLCQGRISDRSSFSLLAGILSTVPGRWEINNWH